MGCTIKTNTPATYRRAQDVSDNRGSNDGRTDCRLIDRWIGRENERSVARIVDTTDRNTAVDEGGGGLADGRRTAH